MMPARHCPFYLERLICLQVQDLNRPEPAVPGSAQVQVQDGQEQAQVPVQVQDGQVPFQPCFRSSDRRPLHLPAFFHMLYRTFFFPPYLQVFQYDLPFIFEPFHVPGRIRRAGGRKYRCLYPQFIFLVLPVIGSGCVSVAKDMLNLRSVYYLP